MYRDLVVGLAAAPLMTQADDTALGAYLVYDSRVTGGFLTNPRYRHA